MSDEAALLNAVSAHAGDDTPRLVYADWLDEHDAPIQAEFIRTQCRLASASAADPDYPDLLERSAEVALQFGPMLRLTAPQLPPGFKHDSEFRRGFLHSAGAEWNHDPNEYYSEPAPPTDEQLDRVCAGLADLVANTTVRHLVLHTMSADALARVLAEPAARAITEFTLSPTDNDAAPGDALIRALAGSPVRANLERLNVYGYATVNGLAALGANPERLRALTVPSLAGRAEEVPALARVPWFRGLRDVRVWNVPRPLQEPLLTAIAGLPRLETLDVRLGERTAFQALGSAGGFPELARLRIDNWGALDRITPRLARGRFPRLAEFALPQSRDDALPTLLGAKWFHQIRVLDASAGYLTDKSAAALSRSAAAPHLRILRVARNRFAKAGLAALGNGARFPELSTLDLRAGYTQVRPETVARFVAELSLPRIRHLHLDGWPLGDAGAKALAANPHLANLTRLSLARCGISDRGFTALARSKHLRNLIELDVGSNNLKRAAALLDAGAFPRLARLDLHHNPITPADRDALHRVRGWLV